MEISGNYQSKTVKTSTGIGYWYGICEESCVRRGTTVEDISILWKMEQTGINSVGGIQISGSLYTDKKVLQFLHFKP